MSDHSTLQGHEIYYNNGGWRYLDDNSATVDGWQTRPCGHCHEPNRPDGHDACLGELPNVINACCGHGDQRQAYVQYTDGRIERGADAQARFAKAPITDAHVGRYAKLKHGFASGLIGVIERNTSTMPLVSPYKHVTKSGIASGIRYLTDIELLD